MVSDGNRHNHARCDWDDCLLFTLLFARPDGDLPPVQHVNDVIPVGMRVILLTNLHVHLYNHPVVVLCKRLVMTRVSILRGFVRFGSLALFLGYFQEKDLNVGVAGIFHLMSSSWHYHPHTSLHFKLLRHAGGEWSAGDGQLSTSDYIHVVLGMIVRLVLLANLEGHFDELATEGRPSLRRHIFVGSWTRTAARDAFPRLLFFSALSFVPLASLAAHCVS
mmetsp:Transcript_10389/g.14325  ORF Transcript_10389/g.14325 Transcript_10389/m.14325 type:complete len:220 (+) Transcript_10389:448-1107(+)